MSRFDPVAAHQRHPNQESLWTDQRTLWFLTRLAKSYPESRERAVAIQHLLLHGQGSMFDDKTWMREWFDWLCVRDQALRPLTWARSGLAGDQSPIWDSGATLDMTQAEYDKKLQEPPRWAWAARRPMHLIEEPSSGGVDPGASQEVWGQV